MVDRDKLEGLIRNLRRYTEILRQIVQRDETRFVSDPIVIGSARYYLQVAIETCINMAHHLIATERLRAPQDYKDTFAVLNEAGIIPAECARTMRELAGLRNLLVHLYWEVDDRMVYAGIRTELDDFETFVGHIVAHLDQGISPK